MTSDTPLFSVIIPTCNRNAELSKALNLLSPSSQKVDPSIYEVIVSDDGTNAAELSNSFPWVKFISGPKTGPASNRNNGAKVALGKWLMFLDDDCLPDKNIINAYKSKIHESEVLEGAVLQDRKRRSLSESAPINITGGYLWSCNMAVLKSTFDRIGGFCEEFHYAAMEDVEFRIRLIKAGLSPIFVKEAAVVHPWREHPGVKYANAHKESTLKLFILHPDERKRLTPAYYIKALLRGVIFSTVPGLFLYRGRGFKNALLLHKYNLDMALTLLTGKDQN